MGGDNAFVKCAFGMNVCEVHLSQERVCQDVGVMDCQISTRSTSKADRQ